MKLHLWGTDFRRSTADFRRHFHIDMPDRPLRLKSICALGFNDLVYLNTCNRIEFYTSARDYYSDTRPLWLSLLRQFGLTEEAFYQGYQLEGKSALRHLLRVACSLESLVVGEPQILGQIRASVRWTLEQGMELLPSLQRAFQLAFETAKKVRTETSIGADSVSVASLGMEQLEHMESEYPLMSAVVVGRSPMSIAVVSWLKKNRPQVPIRWVNRSPARLLDEPGVSGTEVMGLTELLEKPGTFSHLFTATASFVPLFDDQFFERADAICPVAFDFAEPSDIAELSKSSVKVVRLEDLKGVAEKNRERRREAAGFAERIIDEAIRTFFQEQKEAPVLRNFSVLEPILVQEARRFVESVDLKEMNNDEVHQWAEKLVRKNLHTARTQLKSILKSIAESEEVPQNTWDL